MGFSFRGKLPEGFVLSKPIKQDAYDEAEIYELERQGRLIITRKRDGWKLFKATGDATWRHRFYTDGPREIADGRLDALARNFRHGWVFHPRSLMVGEAYFDVAGADDLGLVQSFFAQKDPVKAIEIAEANGGIRYAPFGTPYHWGRRITAPFGEMIEALEQSCRAIGSPLIQTPEILRMSFDEAKKLVVARGWEGLVLYAADFRYQFRLDGKAPKRPWGCWKWKPVNEDDFIVRDRVFHPDGTLKELVLSQIAPNGREFYCGKLGAFDKATRAKLAAMAAPFVVQAEFDERYKKTGKLRVPRFVRVREDKPVDQCVAPKNYPGE